MYCNISCLHVSCVLLASAFRPHATTSHATHHHDDDNDNDNDDDDMLVNDIVAEAVDHARMFPE